MTCKQISFIRRRRVAVLALFAAACALEAPTVIAGGAADEAPGAVVTADSQFGNGTVTGLVRVGGGDRLQVQLPSGSWIDCRTSCRETLRVETVDFWQAQNRMTNDCGIFGCLELRYPGR